MNPIVKIKELKFTYGNNPATARCYQEMEEYFCTYLEELAHQICKPKPRKYPNLSPIRNSPESSRGRIPDHYRACAVGKC
jgi:hypothetical protein